MRNIVLLGCVVFVAALVGCGDNGANNHAHHENNAGDHDGHDHGHHHAAPHGGALHALGDHFAHVEFLVDAEEGEITAWVLDGHAVPGLRVAHEALELKIKISDAETITVSLAAIASATTGETVGDTSEFRGQNDALKTLTSFTGTLTELTVKGQTMTDIAVKYPEGNED